MASFPWKKPQFFNPLHSTPIFKKMFFLHYISQILYTENLNMELIIRAKSFL